MYSEKNVHINFWYVFTLIKYLTSAVSACWDYYNRDFVTKGNCCSNVGLSLLNPFSVQMLWWYFLISKIHLFILKLPSGWIDSFSLDSLDTLNFPGYFKPLSELGGELSWGINLA